MVGIPANQEHGEVHSSCRKNKMEKAITIWNILLGSCFIFPELWMLSVLVWFGLVEILTKKVQRRNRTNLKTLRIYSC